MLRPRLPISATLLALASAPLLSAADGDTATAIAPAAGPADSDPDTAIIVTAGRTSTAADALTRAVTVLDRDEIATQLTTDRSITGLLGQTVPGFGPSTQSLSSFGQTLRGRDMLVLVDGVPVSTPLRDGLRDLSTIDPAALERIEVLRGGSAAYGFGATGGIVNFITRQPATDGHHGSAEVGVGVSTEHIDDSLQWHAQQTLHGRENNLSYVASIGFVQRNSSFDSDGDRRPPDAMGVQGGLDDTDQWQALGKIGYDFADGAQHLDLTVSHYRIRQDSDYTFGFGDPSTDEKTPAEEGSINDEEPGTVHTIVNLGYTHDDLYGSELRLQVYYDDFTATYAKFPGFAQSEIVSEKIGGRATMTTPIALDDAALSVAYGLDWLRDETVQEGIESPTTVPEMTQDAVAGFVEAEIPLADVVEVTAGLRYEFIDLDVESVTNRMGRSVDGGSLSYDEPLATIGFVWFATDTMEVFAGFHQSFSVADIGRAVRDTSSADSAEDFEGEAQTVDSYELGWRYGREALQASLVAFYSESENGTTYATDLSLVKQPERIWGAEGTIQAQLDERWSAGGSVTWMEGEIDTDDDGDFDEDLPGTRIPPLKLTGHLTWEPLPGWRNRLQALYSGDREPDSSLFGGGDVESYIVVDVMAHIDVGPGTLKVGIDNLLNEDYLPVTNQAQEVSYAWVPAPGRTVHVGYGYQW